MSQPGSVVLSESSQDGGAAAPAIVRVTLLVKRIRSAIAIRLLRGIASVESTVRLLAVPMLIRAADLWPAEKAFRLARFFAVILSLLPPYGRSRRFAERARLYGTTANRISFGKAHLQAQFRDFVAVRRIVRGADDPHSRALVERNAELVQELRAKGTPFILATGHFLRQAMAHVYEERITPHAVMAIMARLPANPRRLGERWNQVNYGQMLEAVHKIRPEAKFVSLGDVSALKNLVRDLRKPGHLAVISADTLWPDFRASSLVRPFCGSARRAFPTGAARLARLAGCPILVCVPYLDESGTMVIDWRRRIEVSPDGAEQNDREITNRILDEIERAALERPDQYVIDLLR
jgi:lauroyl/myristoyl acyltransferase